MTQLNDAERDEMFRKDKIKATIMKFTKQLRDMNNVLDNLKPTYFKFNELNENLTDKETEELLGPKDFKKLTVEMDRLASVDWL